MKNIGFKKLLILRASAIAIRPFCVLAEKFIVGEFGLLPLVLSIGSIVFIATSMPVHMGYYKSDLKSESKKTEYISSLSLIILVVSIFSVIFSSIFLQFNLSIIIACFFLIEKIADELARESEYRKKYILWAGVQFYKSLWIILSLVISIFFRNYEFFLLVNGLFFACLSVLFFYIIQREKPIIDSDSVKIIKNTSKYILGNMMGSLYQQVPRVIVATYVPSVAHIFTIVGQALQSINFIFDTKYIARSRRIMSLKPERFYKLFRNSIIYVNIGIGLLIGLSMAVYFCFKFDLNDMVIRSVFVFIIQLADGILYLYMSFMFGYFQWTVRRINIARIFSVGILLYIPFVIAMLHLAQKNEGWWFVGINNVAGIGLITYLLMHLNFGKKLDG